MKDQRKNETKGSVGSMYSNVEKGRLIVVNQLKKPQKINQIYATEKYP
jgi:hypothetical protein